ncbi:TPA: GNAT family N-acetyltransferase [Klebsiella pneumoniae]
MKGMTVIVLMWEEAAIKDDVIEYDIAFNIIYIMRTHVVVAKLRCPSLTKLDMSALQSHHSDHCFQRMRLMTAYGTEFFSIFGGLGIRNYDDIVINNLGYRLSTEAWGKGLATEFAIYAIKFGFDVIKLTEISAVVRENHLASQKVLQKSGLRYVKEIHDVKDAPPSLLYSISVDEWLRNLEVNASV